MLRLQWQKCKKDVWCPLNTVDLSHEAFHVTGVYVIWHEGTSAKTVRVGQGFIRDVLMSHRKDPEVQAFAHLGLFFTWAQVSPPNCNGVEVYLADMLNPRVRSHLPAARPIPVNFPR